MKTTNQNKWNGGRLRAALLGLVLGLAATKAAYANERHFTFTYEPETMVAGATEIEQWMTLAAGRTSRIGEGNYHRWDFRTELEHGITDTWQASLYLNFSQESFRDASLADPNVSKFSFTGVSLENIVNIVNPANHAVGVSLYLEPSYSGDTAEIETKIIVGQRHGDWKWALNLNHAVEWEDNLHAIEGEFGASFGVTRFMGKRWSAGVEVVNINKAPDYKMIETSTIYAGPVVTYRSEKWWATLTVMPQVFGRNWDGVNDGARNLDLVHNERVNVRLLIGFDL